MALSRRTSFEEVGDYESGDVAVIVPSAAAVVTEIVGKIEFASFRRHFLFDADCGACVRSVDSRGLGSGVLSSLA